MQMMKGDDEGTINFALFFLIIKIEKTRAAPPYKNFQVRKFSLFFVLKCSE